MLAETKTQSARDSIKKPQRRGELTVGATS